MDSPLLKSKKEPVSDLGGNFNQGFSAEQNVDIVAQSKDADLLTQLEEIHEVNIPNLWTGL